MNPLEAIRAVYDYPDLTLPEQSVLLQLIDHLPDCRPSIARIAQRAKLGRTATKAALASLIARGFVRRVERPGHPNSFDVDLAQMGRSSGDLVVSRPPPTRSSGDHPLVVSRPPTRSSGDPEVSKTSNQGSKQVARARVHRPKWTRVPSEWEPEDGHRQLAKTEGVDFDRELANFRDHEFKTPRSDANAAFRTWIRNARQFGGGKARHSPAQQGMAPGITPQRWQPRRQAASGGSTG